MKIDPDNSLLLDIQYASGNKREGLPDCIYTIYKDLNTGKKHVITIEEPTVPIWFEKEDRINHRYPVDFREKEDCEQHICKYTEVPFEIAKHMGDQGKAFLKNIFETKNYKNLRMLNMYPYVYGHDYDIRTHYRHAWKKKQKKEIMPDFNKAFLDIEVDSFDVAGFPNSSISPIDLVTVIDKKTKHSYTFALVGREYKEREHIRAMAEKSTVALKAYEEKEAYRKAMYEQRHAQENEIINNLDKFKKKVHKTFDESYPGFEYDFYFYRDELKMLTHLFEMIDSLDPDFMEVWNISFDAPYIMGRLKAHGVDPKNIMCGKEFKNKVCYFKKDRRNFDVKNKTDWFNITSRTIWVDQMINYAAIRKGQEELGSFSLNYVARKELQDEKLDYSEDGNIKTLSYENYEKYILYNIKDVLLQYGIEDVTEDIESLYTTSNANLTPYENCYKQTVVLRNVQYGFYDGEGLVPGANINQILVQRDMDAHPEKYAKKKKGKKEAEFEGALVGNTLIINPFGKPLYGKKTNYMFAYSVDFDMKAFYPYTINTLNISAATLIFKVIVPSDQYDVRGGKIPFHGFTDVQKVEDNNDSFSGDIGGEIIDNFHTGNILSVGHKFMNLPTVQEMEAEILKHTEVA